VLCSKVTFRDGVAKMEKNNPQGEKDETRGVGESTPPQGKTEMGGVTVGR